MDTDEFITEMNNNNEYGRIFHIMVLARRLLLRVRRMNTDSAATTVATNLLTPNIGLNWNNPADRVPLIRIELSNILFGLRTITNPNQADEREAQSLIISLENYRTSTANEGGSAERLRKRKRKRKSIRAKSRKSKKLRKSKKSRKSRR
jgi:hypothetical protein